MVESNVRLEGHDPLWSLTSTTFIYIYYRNESALGSTSFVLFRCNLLFFGGGMIEYSIGWSSSRKYFFFRGKNLGLVSINKLEQLRKYILIHKLKGAHSRKFPIQREDLLKLVKLFRSNQKVYYAGIKHSYDSLT